MAKEALTCKSIFKGMSNEAIKRVFTSKWIEIINRKENNKNYHSKS